MQAVKVSREPLENSVLTDSSLLYNQKQNSVSYLEAKPMSRSPSTEPGLLRPPQQERSRATMERILEGTEDLLRHHLLDEIMLTDILRRARVSVGAFYTRFAKKEALIPFLYERYDRRVTQGAERILKPGRWRGRDLDARVELLFRYVVMLYRTNRGLLRALALWARTHPDFVTQEQRERKAYLYELVTRLLLECRAEMTHPDPDRSVRFGLLMAAAMFREKILYDRAPHPHAVTITDRQLAKEMSRAFVKYVGIKGSQK